MTKSKKNSPAEEKRKNPYDSMDPFTQAKFLYDLQIQTGNKISRAEAYQAAVEIAEENSVARKRFGIN